MKKKIYSILLILVLMASMLFVLTGCGEDDEEDEVHSSNKEAKSSSEVSDTVSKKKVTSPEAFINEFVEYVNNEDVENIIDSIDIVGWLAYGIGYEGYDISYNVEADDYLKTKDFENTYEWVESIENGSAVNVNEKTKEKILEYIPALKAGFRSSFVENIEDVNIQIDKLGKVKKVDNEERLYSVNVEISGSAKINGKKQSFEDEDDVYMIEKDRSYYIVWSKWIGVSRDVVDMSELYDYSKSLVERSILSALFNYKSKFYADDDYAEYTFAEKVTEADFCKEMNSFVQDVFIVKDLDTSKEYSQDDQYDGDSKKLLVDGNKIYICFNLTNNSDMEYYYVTFKEGKDGSIEIDELKQYVDGKWTEIKGK